MKYLKEIGIWIGLVIALIIIIAIIMLPISGLSTHLHEKAHLNACERNNLCCEYNFSLKQFLTGSFNEGPSGKTYFCNSSDFSLLNKSQQTNILMAGILSDIKFMFVMNFLTIATIVSSIFSYSFFKNKKLALIFLIISIILILINTISLFELVNNLSKPKSDFIMLISVLK